MEKHNILNSKRKKAAAVICIILAAAVVGVVVMCVVNSGKKIDFTAVKDGDIPREIETQVLPEYRNLERALACSVDDKIYVVVTRGEKTTSGYSVDIKKMNMNDNTLEVYAAYSDPEEGKAVSQVLTYPYAVAVTNLEALPESIELRIMY